MSEEYARGYIEARSDALLIVQQELKQQHSLARSARECSNVEDYQCRMMQAAILNLVNGRIERLEPKEET